MNGTELDRRGALVLTGAAGAALSIGVGAQAVAAGSAPSMPGRDQDFNAGWRFQRGAADGLQSPSLNDTGWRSVTLPHDWSIEDVPGGVAPAQPGPFDKTSIGGTATGFSQGGEGWYRKSFRVVDYPQDARIEVVFDGIYYQSDVWLNGQHLASCDSGYRPFAVDLTPALRRDGDNVLAVRVRNLGQNSRWYSGSGIYRQVRLDVLPAGARIARWGVAAWTRSISGGAAHIDIITRIDDAGPGVALITRLRDPAGRLAAEATMSAAADARQTLNVRAPHLWSPDNPHLYTLETELRHGSLVIDRIVQPFGIRIVTMDPNRGFAINGERMMLRGGCIHHDNGLLGACAYPDADERKIRLLKARGYNAIRSSHNTPSRSLREACDKLGMVMIAEAFDAWHSPKLPQDVSTHFSDDWQEVVKALVQSGRNSPSIVMWSIGNEIPYRNSDEGVDWAWKLAQEVHRHDPTRPVTEALNGVLGPVMVAGEGTARAGRAGKPDNASTIFLDVPGYNYRLHDIEGEHGPHPERAVYASETFPHDAYDYNALARRAPYFMGEFVWTAMDYIGEAGIGGAVRNKSGVVMPVNVVGWPWVVSWCGDIDLIGCQKAPSLARDVVWGVSALEMAVQRPVPEGLKEVPTLWGWSDELASWSWPGAEGKVLMVRVYCSAERVELRLGGTIVGQHSYTEADKQHAEFAVPYAAGVLEAVAYKGGKVVGRRRLETVGAPARLRLVAEKHGRELRYVTVEVLDSAGRLVPDAARAITVAVEGDAQLLGFGSANPQASGSCQQPTTTSFRGRALAILRRAKGASRITARAEGLASASVLVG